jgi:hydrogenase/urease accessory protein HupE
MLPGDGFVDTLQNVSNVDLHGGLLSDLFNPYAAVPSMHMGYALMIGAVGALLVHNWLLRVAFLLYPIAVFVIIVGTANHYVVDALAGMAVVMAGFVLIALWLHLRGKPIVRNVPPPRSSRRLHAPCGSR